MATIIAGACVALMVIGILRVLYRDKKSGKSPCGGDCAHCGGSCPYAGRDRTIQ